MAKLLQKAAANKRKREQTDQSTLAALVAADASKKANSTPKKSKKSADEIEAATDVPIESKTIVKKSTKTVDVVTESNDVKQENVIYVGHIPHGFYEKEMRKFFTQFGEVGKLKLFRSKKTGNSKGYAFVQFLSSEVAEIVAQALDGYLIMDRKLVCNVVPASKMHEGMLIPSKVPSKKVSDISEVKATEDEIEAPVVNLQQQADRFLKSQKKKMQRLQELGIDFELLNPVPSSSIAK